MVKKARVSGPEARNRPRPGHLLAVSLVLALAIFVVILSLNRHEVDEYESSYVPPPAPVFDYEHVSFLGDDYTVGVGALTEELGYASVLSRRQCWEKNIDAVSDTGYENGGPDDSMSFINPKRIESITNTQPRLIIIQGGTNDKPSPTLYNSAQAVYRAIQTAAPSAKIIVVGPAQPPQASESDLRAVRADIEKAARDTGITFVDPTVNGWLALNDYASDGAHPNTEGHAKLAMKLREVIRALELPRFDSCAPVEQTR
ncbi:SGNH/GDSL hydrolase family protein [Rhodococcus sp. 077-4]|uniref:SGNH/GDSL hydrolase family protein n=1 Tax=Rhodococcus sp. 077-4 TaxID=2789271 RepID=UPI0039F5C84D